MILEIKNNYYIKDDVVYIELNRRTGEKFYTLIDINDFHLMEQFKGKWFSSYDPDHDGYYAQAVVRNGVRDGKTIYTSLTLHKYLMSPKNGYVIDHINHNSLDNRRCNLREIKPKSNLRNRSGRNKNNKSGYRNVAVVNGEYRVQIMINGKNTVLGTYSDLEEAASIAKKAREKYYGEFAGEK